MDSNRQHFNIWYNKLGVLRFSSPILVGLLGQKKGNFVHQKMLSETLDSYFVFTLQYSETIVFTIFYF